MPLNDELASTLTMVLAGGRGNRLQPLTRDRAKPAVPFGGLYRIIDFTLSNCIHSGLRRIYVLTQYQARSLEEHMRFGWNFLPRRLGQFITTRSPNFLGTSATWYAGTADAIYQNLDTFREERPDRVLILSGDHIYKMDYGRMLAEHLENNAALTIGAIPVPEEEARRFGVFECAAGGRVLGFQEKPDQPKLIPGRPGWSLASMGIYLFDTEALVQCLQEDARDPNSSHDFGKDVIPKLIDTERVFAHRFVGHATGEEAYWKDIGTLESYFDANIDLCSALPKFNLYDSSWPIFTRQHAEPPAKTVGSSDTIVNSLLCPGVVVSAAQVTRSILSYRSRVEEGAEVENSMLFAGVEVGAGCRIRGAIIDKWTTIPPGTEIGYDQEADRRRFQVSETGIVVVSRKFDFGEMATSADSSTS